MQVILSILENLRYRTFWFLDILKGSKIKNHLNEVRYALENFDTQQTRQTLKYNLEKILRHSKKTVPFYTNITNLEILHDFPVINKNIIKDHYTSFLSQSFQKEKNRTVATSGSTGTPLKIIQNKNKIARSTADTIYFSELAGYKLGYRLLFVRHWNSFYKKTKLKTWIQNIYPIEVLSLNQNNIDKLIKQIKRDPSNKGWLGFPSAFEQICKHLDNVNSPPIDANIKSIIGMAESVNTYTKQSMERYFKVPLVSRYSNTENGIIAQQDGNASNDFKVNWASFYVEILNLESDEPVNSGERGRIVVTDLFNYAMPLIRYDTGDIGALDNTVSPPSLKYIEGRKSDTIYNTKGEIVSSFIMTNSTHYNGINQIQLIQKDNKKYIIKLNCDKASNLKQQLITDFKQFLGNDADITIIYVDEIPLLDSGKRKVTVNDFIRKPHSNQK